jgi:hypothetical protein
MDLRFFEDPDTEQPHIYNHHVTEEEVRQVLSLQVKTGRLSMTLGLRLVTPVPAAIDE